MELQEKEAETLSFPVTITANAIEEVKRLLAANPEAEGKSLRVGVKGGGCSGMTYVLEFDGKKDGDEEFLIHGVPVIMNKSHELYLYGMTVDFEQGLNARGFVFHNPNAKTTCGCGTSFSA